jgi:hypothetical protein
MARVPELVAAMRANPKNVRFVDALRVAREYFGEPRIKGSHHIFRTPWPGDPRINLQEDKNGKAKKYQVDQLLEAIDLKESQP